MCIVKSIWHESCLAFYRLNMYREVAETNKILKDKLCHFNRLKPILENSARGLRRFDNSIRGPVFAHQHSTGHWRPIRKHS